ncbi:E3 ubiquitin ligase [Actinomortierella ambigua]|nr:E3 ubiquitin ligase [Actinomortierella ambigua]
MGKKHKKKARALALSQASDDNNPPSDTSSSPFVHKPSAIDLLSSPTLDFLDSDLVAKNGNNNKNGASHDAIEVASSQEPGPLSPSKPSTPKKKKHKGKGHGDSTFSLSSPSKTFTGLAPSTAGPSGAAFTGASTHSSTSALTSPTPVKTSKLNMTAPSTAAALISTSASMDDMAALDLLMEKTAETEVKELQALVEKLRKEIAFKDETIAKLQEELARRPAHTSSGPAANGSLVHTHRDPTMQCAVCVDYFAVPYTVECGHTFCYTCLHNWLAIRKECPTCRTKLMRRPAMSFIVREQVQAAVERLPEPDRSAVKERLALEDASVKAKQADGDAWKGIFRPIEFVSTVFDKDDDVRRCVSCGWEVIGGACTGCNTAFSDVEDSDHSQDRTDGESGDEDAYDSNDSFINDDGGEDEGSESEGSFNGRGSGSDSDNSEGGRPLTRAARRQRRARKQGPDPMGSSTRLRRNLLRGRGAPSQPIDLDEDEEEEDKQDDDDLAGLVFESDLGEDDGTDGDSEEEPERDKPRRRQAASRRIIQLSDDEEDEEGPTSANAAVPSNKRRRLLVDSDEDSEEDSEEGEEEDGSDVEEIAITPESSEVSESESESGSEEEEEEAQADSEDDFVIDRTTKSKSTKHKDKKQKKDDETKRRAKDKKTKKKKKKKGKEKLESLFAD